jgi:PIN domain nuclease of toxin-antitoxin system
VVKKLLDTGPLLWTVGWPERLSTPARECISEGGLWLSVASYWEIVIKARKGLLKVPDPVSWWGRATELLQAEVLPIRASHVGTLATLPELHRDPFDRILIAQAIVEGLPLVTHDSQMGAYPVRVVW